MPRADWFHAARALTCDGRPTGHSMTVHHPFDDWHTTGYTIDRVAAQADNRYRLDLRGKPPVYQNKLYARRISPDRLRVNATTTWLYKRGTCKAPPEKRLRRLSGGALQVKISWLRAPASPAASKERSRIRTPGTATSWCCG